MPEEKGKEAKTSSPVSYLIRGGFSLDKKYDGKKIIEIRNELQLPSDISFCLQGLSLVPFFYVSAASPERARGRIKEYKEHLEAKGIKVDLEKIEVK